MLEGILKDGAVPGSPWKHGLAPGPEDKLLLQSEFQLCNLKYALPLGPGPVDWTINSQEVEILVPAAHQELEIYQTNVCGELLLD